MTPQRPAGGLRHWCAALCLCTSAAVPAAEVACIQQQGRPAVTYQGEVEEQDGGRVRQAFARCFDGGRRPATLLLSSPGGSVNGGFDVANFLLAWNLERGPVTTRVPSGHRCISACTFIFAAGAFREVQTGASYEPHGFSAFSGPRLDHAMTALLDPPADTARRVRLQHARLRFMSRVMLPMAASDPRLQWVAGFLGPWQEGPTAQGVQAAARQWAQFSSAQQLALARLDSVTQLIVTELERSTALRVLQRHLDRLAQRPASPEPPASDEAARLATAYRTALNLWIAQAGAGAPLADLGDGAAALRQAMTERAASAQGAVDRQLWPFFERRRDAIDIEGLLRLMFSTSIVYTRPLTREELCDLNVVNRDCD